MGVSVVFSKFGSLAAAVCATPGFIRPPKVRAAVEAKRNDRRLRVFILFFLDDIKMCAAD
jgi:hypothetical protein